MSSVSLVAVRRSGWVALVVTCLARAVLSMLGGLLIWSMLPLLLGWHPTLVMTGSMEPRLTPGDVVLSRPVDPATLRPGQIVLVHDPDHPGRLRMHRFVRFDGHGELVTRGDANAQNDSTPVARAAVVGVGSLLVPDVGQPVLWLRDGQTGPLVLVGVSLVLIIRLAFWFRAQPEDPDDEDDGGGTSAERVPPRRRLRARHLRPSPVAQFRRRAVGVAVVSASAVAVFVAGTFGAQAAAFHAATTTPTGTWKASTYFTCANAELAKSPTFALPLADAVKTNGATAADISGNSHSGSYSSGASADTAGPCANDGTGRTRLGATTLTSSGSVTVGSLTSLASPSALTFEVWFKTSATSGNLMSLSGTLLAGLTGQVALTLTSGKVSFGESGLFTSSVSATSLSTYADGKWHLAVGTLGSGAITVYVDTAASAVSTAYSGSASVGSLPSARIGGSSYAGSVGYAAIYPTALTPTDVTSQWDAAQCGLPASC